jgi:ABC-type branched-subunit amino acid transport system permease subunit
VLILMHTGLPLALAFVGAGLVAAGIGALSAIPLLRLRGVYFSVGTLGVMIAVQTWVINWKWAGQTTACTCPRTLVIASGLNETGPIQDLEYEDWKDVMDANVRGPWVMAKAFGTQLIAAGHPGRSC